MGVGIKVDWGFRCWGGRFIEGDAFLLGIDTWFGVIGDGDFGREGIPSKRRDTGIGKSG